MNKQNDIEQLSADYATAMTDLAYEMGVLESAVRALKAKYLPGIKRDAARAAAVKAKLKARIEESPEQFIKPRTLLFHGVKVGFAKSKGTVSWSDEDAVIRRIRERLPKDQVELLIRSKENVHKPAVYDLVAADLKRLGIEITDAGDQVVIKLTDSDIEKIVDALLKGEEAQ